MIEGFVRSEIRKVLSIPEVVLAELRRQNSIGIAELETRRLGTNLDGLIEPPLGCLLSTGPYPGAGDPHEPGLGFVGFMRRVYNLQKIKQQGFAFDDPESRTRSGVLNVVYAHADKVAPLDGSLFENFSSIHALTYTSSIPMIVHLLKDNDFEDFECVFGHGGILSREAADILGFQAVVD